MSLSINSTTGTIDLSASTPGTYVVSYTVGNKVATQNITITDVPDTNFSYSSNSYAQDGTDPTPSISGDSGGTFTSSPSGLSINSSTGEIDLSASTIGTYTVTYSISTPCSSTTNRTVAITAAYSGVYSVGMDGVNDYLQENYYNALSGQNDFSISLWVYFKGASTLYPLFVLWDNPSYVTLVRRYAGQWQFYRRTPQNLTRSVLYTSSIEQNRWYHLVCVNNGNTMKIYLDGVNVATNTNATGGTKTENIGAKIGVYPASTYFYGNMLIDEVTNYTSALSSSDVTSLYNNGVPITPIGNPVNWWKMGEDSAGNAPTIANDGSGNNFLTRTNGASYFTVPAGVFNQRSIDFDGTDDRINFGDNNSWSFNSPTEGEDNPLSISAWIRIESSSGGILGKYATNGYEWLFYVSGGQLVFIVRENSVGTPYKLKRTVSNVITTNTWFHVVATYTGVHNVSGYGMNLYVNGTLQSAQTAQSGTYIEMTNTTTPMGMGAYAGNATSGSFNGRIDECALFDYVLPQNAITEIYNSGSPQKDLNNLTNATTDPIMWARGGDRDTFSTLTNRGSVNQNGTYTNMAIDDINFVIKT